MDLSHPRRPFGSASFHPLGTALQVLPTTKFFSTFFKKTFNLPLFPACCPSSTCGSSAQWWGLSKRFSPSSAASGSFSSTRPSPRSADNHHRHHIHYHHHHHHHLHHHHYQVCDAVGGIFKAAPRLVQSAWWTILHFLLRKISREDLNSKPWDWW